VQMRMNIGTPKLLMELGRLFVSAKYFFVV
jgi:hypothetical protein